MLCSKPTLSGHSRLVSALILSVDNRCLAPLPKLFSALGKDAPVSGTRYLIGQVGRRLDSKNSSSDLPGGEMCISVFPSVHVAFTSAFLGEETSLASPSFHLQGVYEVRFAQLPQFIHCQDITHF